ncbi:MAG: hypothetical protein AAB426_09430 [Myxococcota bacterium]
MTLDRYETVPLTPPQYGYDFGARRIGGTLCVAWFALKSHADLFVTAANNDAATREADDAALRAMLAEECGPCDGSCEGQCDDCDEIARARADDANDARREHESLGGVL